MQDIRSYIGRCRARYAGSTAGWNGETSCILKAFIDLYRAAGDPADRQFALDRIKSMVDADGSIPGSEPGGGPGIFSCGGALLFALDETGDERYRKAADHLHAQLSAPADAETRSGRSLPYCLYMTQPFRAEYDRRFLSGLEAAGIAGQFRASHESMSLSGLTETGLYLMALADCVGQMAEQLYEHRRLLMDLFLDACRGVLPLADPETGLFGQAESSAMIAYALMKGVRLGLLDPERYLAPGLTAFRSLAGRKPDQDGSGIWLIMAWSEYITAREREI